VANAAARELGVVALSALRPSAQTCWARPNRPYSRLRRAWPRHLDLAVWPVRCMAADHASTALNCVTEAAPREQEVPRRVARPLPRWRRGLI